MTQSRHTIQLCLLLACWLVSSLPHMAVEQGIKPTFIIECDNPDVTAEVSSSNQFNGYLPAGMEITAAWKQGNDEGNITVKVGNDPVNGKYVFLSDPFTPTRTGTLALPILLLLAATGCSREEMAPENELPAGTFRIETRVAGTNESLPDGTNYTILLYSGQEL